MALLYNNAYVRVGSIMLPGIVYDTFRFQAGSVFGQSFIPNVLNPINQTYQALAVNMTGVTPDVSVDENGIQTAIYTLTAAQLQARII